MSRYPSSGRRQIFVRGWIHDGHFAPIHMAFVRATLGGENIRLGPLQGWSRNWRPGGTALDSGRRPLVGVNRFTIPKEQEKPVTVHKIRADEWGAGRAQYLKEFRAKRDAQAWSNALAQLEAAYKTNTNMVPVIMNALPTA